MTGNFLVLNSSTVICKKKQNTKNDKKCFGRSVFAFLLIGLVCFAGIMYVFQINQLATMGYEIKQKENKIEELEITKKELEVKAAQLRSIYNLEGRKGEMNMKKPAEVGVIEIELERPVAFNAD